LDIATYGAVAVVEEQAADDSVEALLPAGMATPVTVTVAKVELEPPNSLPSEPVFVTTTVEVSYTVEVEVTV
jgi:hypothetical protein